MLQVAVIEQDVNRRESLQNYFKNENGFGCLMANETVVDFFEALRLRRSRPDVLLIDYSSLAQSDKILPQIKNRTPNTEIVMLATNAQDEGVLRAFYWGASGCLLKTTPMQDIKQAIMNIRNGGAALSPAVARQLIGYFNAKHKPQNATPLSEREREVVWAIEQGKTHKQTAEMLKLSVETVRTHAKNIYKKLNITTKAELVAMSVRGQI